MNGKQRLFVAEYQVDHNATKAAERAGYSHKSAHVTASRLLKNAKVAQAIASAEEKRAKKLDVTPERILKELARLAYLDPRDLFDEKGDIRPIHTLDEDTARAVAGFDYETLYEHYAKGQSKPVGRVAKVKFADKGQNLERLGRHLKLFTDKVEHSADSELIARLTGARKRLGTEGGAT